MKTEHKSTQLNTNHWKEEVLDARRKDVQTNCIWRF